MKKLQNIIFYTLLLLHFPVFYTSNNISELSISAFIELLGITFVIGFIIIIIISIILRVIKKPINPIIVLIGIFLFFSYGIFYQGLINEESHVRHIVLLPIFAMVFLVALKYSPKSTKKTTQIIFSILIILMVSDLFTFFSEYEYESVGEYWNFSEDFDNMELENFPSIIWIIPDEYPSYDSLQLMTSYDNSNFINNLADMGFEIKDMRSNYDFSAYSIPSTMNMEYITKTDKHFDVGKEMSNSRLVQILQSNNYELTHINGEGGYHLDNFDNNLCDHNIILRNANYFDTNMVLPILIFTQPLYLNIVYDHVRNVECHFEELIQVENINSKQKFVLAHVLLPHRPHLIENEWGSLERRGNDHLRNPAEGFIGNIEIVNQKLIESLPIIIENNPNTIILIMSDHGFRYDPDVDFQKATEFQKFRYDNFVAIYLPNNFELENNVNSNVNIFRSIFQNVSENIPILEDRFFHVCYTEIKEFYDFENYTLGSKKLIDNCLIN